MADRILDVDLIAFEQGAFSKRAAVVDGVRRSLATGFVFMSHDLPADLLGEVLLKLHQRTAELQRRFLRIIAVGLGAHEALFDSCTADGAHLTRAVHYPPMSSAPGAEHVWAAEHRDINLITALPRATAKGLEVMTEDGWIAAAPPDDHVIINTGIMLDRISNGVIPAGVHRVVADPDEVGGRISVVQFCHPTPWTVLAPLPTCVSAEQPQRDLPIDAGSLLDQVLWDINLIDNAADDHTAG